MLTARVAGPSEWESMKLSIAFFALPLLLAAQPDAREIVRKSIQADNFNAERARNYSMTQRTIERTLDSSGKVKDTETKTVDVLMIHGEPYRKQIAKNDKPLSPDEQQKEEEKMQRASVSREKVTEAERAKKRLKQREFLQEIPEAYDFRVVREEKV